MRERKGRGAGAICSMLCLHVCREKEQLKGLHAVLSFKRVVVGLSVSQFFLLCWIVTFVVAT